MALELGTIMSADTRVFFAATRRQPESHLQLADETLSGLPCATQVYVLGGAAHAADGSTIEAIRRAAFGMRRGRQLRDIIVLMDPDDSGRRGAVLPRVTSLLCVQRAASRHSSRMLLTDMQSWNAAKVQPPHKAYVCQVTVSS
jgi:hypothetical protein